MSFLIVFDVSGSLLLHWLPFHCAPLTAIPLYTTCTGCRSIAAASLAASATENIYTGYRAHDCHALAAIPLSGTDIPLGANRAHRLQYHWLRCVQCTPAGRRRVNRLICIFCLSCHRIPFIWRLYCPCISFASLHWLPFL